MPLKARRRQAAFGFSTWRWWLPVRSWWQSACDHAHKDTILAHEMMIKRRADMRGRQAGDENCQQSVHREKPIGERAVLGPDRRQLEQSEHDDRRAIGGGGHPAKK